MPDINIDTLLVDAKKEIALIKQHATVAEWEVLIKNISRLDGNQGSKCVYGLMCNGCFTDRAIELILLCNQGKFYRGLSRFAPEQNTIEVNGKVDIRDGRNFTSMEILLSISKHVVVDMINDVNQGK